MGKKESLTFDNVAVEEIEPVFDPKNSPGGDFKRGKGIYISPVVIFIYILVTVALALIVGLIVHYAHPDRNKPCDCAQNGLHSQELRSLPAEINITWEMCLNMSRDLNERLPLNICTTEIPTTNMPTSKVPGRTSQPLLTGLRLPTTLKPFHYNLDIKPDIYQTKPTLFNFAGKVDIFLRCVEETKVIKIHFKLLFIDGVSVVDINTNSNISISNITVELYKEFYNIILDENLSVGQEVRVHMEFKGSLFQDMHGMYWSSYSVNGTTKYMMSTQFESTDARKAFPCLDEPHLKSTFNVSLWRKKPMVALSNMPRYTTEDMGDGWYKDSFLQTPVVLSTYLMAFAVAEFDFIDTTTSGGDIKNQKYMRYFSRPDYIANGFADYASEISTPIVNYFEDYFNHSYALPKIDQITVPDFAAGAMENWGLITYRESRLLVDPRYTTEYAIWRFTRTISHELLHQWLGNTVTVAWWDDLWLQEGAARYFENIGVQHAKPDWNQTITYIAMTFHWALENDQDGDSHPIYNPGIEQYHSIESMFSTITYDKGSTVYRMIHQYIFRDYPEAFDQAMKSYVQRNMYSNVQHDDLLQIFDESASALGLDVNVTEVVYTWIKQMGYPVVTFERSPDGSSVRVTQTMFLIDRYMPLKEVYPSPYNYSWEVPLSYYTSQEITPKFDWLHKENKTLTLTKSLGENDWILGNYHQLGFYRVNYDSVTWEAIIKQLTTNFEAINVIQRGQILDDAFDMGRAMVTDQLHSLRATEYLVNEREYLPWYTYMHGIAYTEWMVSSLAEYGLFREYMGHLVNNNYARFGWTKQSQLLDGFLQILSLRSACKYGIPDCIKHSVEVFKQWMKLPDDLTIITPDFRSTVYCYAIQQDGTEETWDFLFKQYQEVDHELERMTIRDSLGCTLHSWLLHRYFEMGAKHDPKIYYLDHTSVMKAVAKNYPSGTIVAFDYLSQYWKNMTSTKFHILSEIVKRYSTDYEKTKFQDFVRHHPAEDYVDEAAYENMIYTIDANIRWRKLNEHKVVDWLKQARKRQLEQMT